MAHPTETEDIDTDAPETGQRVSRRQRRIEEQRKKLEQVRGAQRRRRLIIGLAIFAIVATLAALVVFLYQPPAPAQGRQVLIEGQEHVPVGTDLQYRSRPPASGPHYAQTSGYGVFENEVSPGYWVHTLEHGGIVVLYHPDQCDAACLEELRQVYNAAPTSQYFVGLRKMAVIPYEDMDSRIAVLAWGWIDEMAEVDRERILSFYREHVDRGPERAQ